ncbi:outer membrane protein assembly factor BamB [Flavobacterium nitrogenifigens]|uniref:Outer membrane protein assembly factor BamB n=2 Tax=Flavobacterium TaxID=237 RepID=A0A7W7N621_9FLAO|nr:MULTISPECIES: PQQ-binding-like beta-propeller repeat protein [Flavobacterium]MBB4799984.1 outer membrane protein assembly factor BamB [Flavobacterium nitrogenifigens]MBB6386266.1 outer membrane protein assembly factor BamB [Flavobacterium notoginsengisoli]
MKQKLTALLFVFTAINMFSQAPASKTNYSNKTLTATDMVTNKALKPLKKVPLDEASILIYDYDGSLFSWDLESETIVWTVKAADASSEMCANKITLQDGVVYVPFINGEIFAIDNQTGAIFWKSRLGSITDQIVLKDQTPIVSNGKLFIIAQNQNQSSNLYALDLKDGSLAWNFKFDTAINDTTPLLFDNKIFTQSGTNAYVFEANTGKLISQKTFEEAMTGNAVTDGQNVFMASEKNNLFALNPNSLDIVWQFKFDENQNNVKERIICKDNKIYIGAQGSQVSSLYAIDSKTGTQLWKTDFKDDNIEYIVKENENIWGYTRKKRLFELDLANGEIAFEAKLTTLPISNFEFPKEDNLLYYYCDAGLIQFDLNEKDENMYYMRTSLADNPYSAYLKIIR